MTETELHILRDRDGTGSLLQREGQMHKSKVNEVSRISMLLGIYRMVSQTHSDGVSDQLAQLSLFTFHALDDIVIRILVCSLWNRG